MRQHSPFNPLLLAANVYLSPDFGEPHFHNMSTLNVIWSYCFDNVTWLLSILREGWVCFALRHEKLVKTLVYMESPYVAHRHLFQSYWSYDVHTTLPHLSVCSSSPGKHLHFPQFCQMKTVAVLLIGDRPVGNDSDMARVVRCGDVSTKRRAQLDMRLLHQCTGDLFETSELILFRSKMDYRNQLASREPPRLPKTNLGGRW